jgi:hypothetical protein
MKLENIMGEAFELLTPLVGSSESTAGYLGSSDQSYHDDCRGHKHRTARPPGVQHRTEDWRTNDRAEKVTPSYRGREDSLPLSN